MMFHRVTKMADPGKIFMFSKKFEEIRAILSNRRAFNLRMAPKVLLGISATGFLYFTYTNRDTKPLKRVNPDKLLLPPISQPENPLTQQTCVPSSILSQYLPQHMKLLAAENSPPEEPHHDEGDVFHLREQRFLDFASIFYDGEIYMTPQDFLLSVSQEQARARQYRLQIEKEKVERWLKATPRRNKGSSKFFRSINDEGLISYVEYLFLLCILTEPKSGFEIAFDMFDIDGNHQVDINEFKVLYTVVDLTHYYEELARLFSKMNRKSKLEDKFTAADLPHADGSVSVSLERILSMKKTDQGETDEEKNREMQSTTLIVHLFGEDGKAVLKYNDFVKFTESLQLEVLDMEFQAFARGMPTISEEDFARILLTYTNLSDASVDDYLERVRSRIHDNKGVKFEDFKAFFSFLNHMDDFVLMMRLYNLTDQPISKADFRRAVMICAGEQINPSVIDAVYTIFDVDGDGHLSTEEFISIMKSRLKRGLRTHLVKEDNGWGKFKSCVKHEMKLKRGGM